DSWEGFEWLAADDSDANFLAYKRKDRKGKEVLVLINFSGGDLNGYRLGVEPGKYQVIFNSDSPKYGGSGKMKKRIFNATKSFCHGKEYSIGFDIPKFTCFYLTKIM
ncbi:MAG: alpha amylase C-terminal domain-containing protein, partial [Clostridia bacterium]|nr:alpha amylase C-terminal domain-containing protein [Clostridia bacterium]